MTVNKNFVLNALLRYNYFPMQPRDREELPPVFSSTLFTPKVARLLVKTRRRNNPSGYDVVEYKLTRFNEVPRVLSIPHPVAYAHLALSIFENWKHLKYITENQNSLIRPRRHKDGRLMIMRYENPLGSAHRYAKRGFGCRFIARADIANCFPSIYSHAVSWAIVGHTYAKTHRARKNWFNQLDEKVRWAKRNETQGIAIGPATSNIIAEAILARVDEILKKEDFSFVRLIDNYYSYCTSDVEAQKFIRRLAEELSKYKLLLNIKKTGVTPLPQTVFPKWKSHLALLLPSDNKFNAYDAINYIDFAVSLAKEMPDGSVLKYAVKRLLGHERLTTEIKRDVLPYVISLSFYHPILLPLLETTFKKAVSRRYFPFGKELNELARENARLCRSDGMCWALHYLNKYKIEVEDDVADKVVASRDCLSLLLLYQSRQRAHQTRVVDFANRLNTSDRYELDQYWLLRYHMFKKRKITTLSSDEQEAFKILNTQRVSFVS